MKEGEEMILGDFLGVFFRDTRLDEIPNDWILRDNEDLAEYFGRVTKGMDPEQRALLNDIIGEKAEGFGGY